MIEETICDLCGQSTFTTIYKGNIQTDDDGLTYFSSSREKAGHWPIVKCNHCGLHRSNPRDNQETLRAIYEQLEDEIYDEEDENRAYIALKRIKQINRLQKVGRLLDIGCSSGIFAHQAALTGWGVTGIDPSLWAITQAKNRYPEGNYVVSSIEDANFPPDVFTLITLWDVLEHVSSPTETLQKINPWLANGGFVVLNVPDINSLIARVMKDKWVMLLREHLWYFSPKTMTQLLQKTGFEVISIKFNKVRFSLKNIFTRISQYPSLKFLRPLSRLPGMQKISINFSIGEMQIYARKSSQ